MIRVASAQFGSAVLVALVATCVRGSKGSLAQYAREDRGPTKDFSHGVVCYDLRTRTHEESDARGDTRTHDVRGRTRRVRGVFVHTVTRGVFFYACS